MNYWLYITTADNWEATKKSNILGAADRHRNALSKMKNGDKCLIYVMSRWNAGQYIEPTVVAEYEVTSHVFEDSSEIFHSPVLASKEVFKQRVSLKPLKILETPVKFKPLVEKLSFIKNKRRWSLNIRGRAIVRLPEQDYSRIIASPA